MPKFEKQNLKRIDPRWFLNETVEKTKLEQLQEVLTEQTQVLKRGMKETDPNGPIHKLQTYLKDKNLYRGEPDGKYGRGTQLAVRALQLQLIRGKKLPPKQPSGKSSADGIAGPQTLTAAGLRLGATPLPGAASATSIPGAATSTQQRASSSEEPKPMYGKRWTTRTDLISAGIIKNLKGWVDEPKMSKVVKLLKMADDKGILSQVVQRYRNKTGDGLQGTIRGVMGVHKLKNQALAILGGEAEAKDITTQIDDAVPQSVQDTIRDIYGAIPFTPWNAIASAGRVGKLLKYGPPQYRVAFKFAAGSTTPFTTKDLKESEIDEISEFMDSLTNPQNPQYMEIMKKAGRYRKYFKEQAENARKKGGKFGFGNMAFGCKDPEKCNNELYSAFRAIAGTRPEEGVQVNPESTVGKLKLMMGQFTAINEGSYWLIKDFFDFNDWKELADNNAGFQAYYEKTLKSLEGVKDQIVGKKTDLGAECAKRKDQRGVAYNVARCFLPIRHALMPSDKFPWETGAFSAYKGFPVILKIRRKQGQPQPENT